jgi:1-acyl-sn-glycerol-3-phosphate acyltransferase
VLELTRRGIVPPKNIGPWMRLAVLVLKPTLTVLTKRDWHGMKNIPRTGGVVVCPNHISYADPLTFAHFIYDAGRAPRFLAKAALFEIPLIGRLLRGAGQIPVLRASKDASLAFSAAVDAVKRGECVCIYPEGTVTRDPQLWPMVGKTGAARVALATGAPVIPVAQWGPQRILPPYHKVPRILTRHRIRLVAGPPVDLSEYEGRELSATILRAATERIMLAVTALLAEVRDEPPPSERYDPGATDLPRIGYPYARIDERSSA